MRKRTNGGFASAKLFIHEEHTIAQTIAGALLGIVLTTIQLLFFKFA